MAHRQPRLRILISAEHYLPGWKAGGPIRSIHYLATALKQEFEFFIVARDRDLGDRKPYPGIPSDRWIERDGICVRYLPPAWGCVRGWLNVLTDANCDLVYFNSFFSPGFTILPLALRCSGIASSRPVIIAPRGEFSAGALGLKKEKKRAFCALFRLLRLHTTVGWHATSEAELQDLRHVWGKQARIELAPPVLSQPAPHAQSRPRPPKTQGSARIVFLSRISRKKNLHFALSLLYTVRGQVQFDIYGPEEDLQYWDECRALIAQMPPNIHATYCGGVAPDLTIDTLARYHAFLFPTLGENFGHVILEALEAGCLPLISDRTPWQDLDKHGVGWDLPLEAPSAFCKALQQCLDMDQSEWLDRSRAAECFARDYRRESLHSALDGHRRMFMAAHR